MRWHSVAYARVHPWACCTVLLLMAGSLFALAWVAFTPPAARVIYNASDSVPVGWYRVTPLDAEIATPRDAIAVDSFVLTRLPASVATLADQRGYLPLQVPLLKRVGAVAPQHICISGGYVRIDGGPVATVLPPMHRGDHCRFGNSVAHWSKANCSCSATPPRRPSTAVTLGRLGLNPCWVLHNGSSWTHCRERAADDVVH